MKATVPLRSAAANTRLNIAIAFFSAGFVAVLALSPYWDRSIQVVHLFESFPYLIAGALCLWNRKSGYALAVAAGTFWLWTAGFLTTIVRNGFERLAMLATTGHVDRLGILLAVPAALMTGGLALTAFWGYLRLPEKRLRDLALFVSAFIIVGAWFLGIFALFAPQYLGIFRRLLH